MSRADLFSASEHTILMIIVLLMCFAFYKDVSNKIIDAYNEEVRWEQQQKMNEANGEPNFHFTLYDSCGGPPLWHLIIALQFATNPFLLFLIKRRTLGKFIFSTFLNFLMFYGYFAWANNAFNARVLNEHSHIADVGFGGYLFPGSTALQQFSFVLISALLVLQIFFLIRFVMERFNARIHLA
jgi:hypothetical protein